MKKCIHGKSDCQFYFCMLKINVIKEHTTKTLCNHHLSFAQNRNKEFVVIDAANCELCVLPTNVIPFRRTHVS